VERGVMNAANPAAPRCHSRLPRFEPLAAGINEWDVGAQMPGFPEMHPDTSQLSAGGAYGPQNFEGLIVSTCGRDIGGLAIRRELGRPRATRLL